MDATPIVLERLLNAPVATVWKAITDKDEMKQWYFNLPEFKAEVGFEFEMTGGKTPEKQYLHHCMVTEVIVNKKISYTWRFVGYEGNSLVTFELAEEGNQTRLTLTHSGIETFSANEEDFAIGEFEIGWAYLLDNSLKPYLEKTIK